MKRYSLSIVLLLALFLTSCGVKEQMPQVSAPAPTATQVVKTAEPTANSPETKTETVKETAKPAFENKAVKTGEKAVAEVSSNNTAPAPTPNITAESKVQDKKTDTITVSVKDGDGKVMLENTVIEYKSNMTSFDALKAAAEGKLEVKADGIGQFVYVRGIGKLYEFDKGAMSGWLYFVNGVKASVGAGAYNLKSGDMVQWKYTLDGNK